MQCDHCVEGDEKEATKQMEAYVQAWCNLLHDTFVCTHIETKANRLLLYCTRCYSKNACCSSSLCSEVQGLAS